MIFSNIMTTGKVVCFNRVLMRLVRLHGRVGKGVGHLVHDEAMGRREVMSLIPDRGAIVG